MSITKALYFYISNISHSCFLNIISKLFEFGCTAKEICMSDMKFINLSGIKNHDFISLNIFEVYLFKSLKFNL